MSEPIGEPGLDYSLHYRTWHNETPEHVQRMTRHFKGLLEAWLPVVPGGAALDIGCAMGFTLLALRELGYQDCCGIDTDAAQIAAARRLGAPAELVDDSIGYLKARPNRFQIVTLLDVLEHVPPESQVGLVRAIHGALAPGGRLILQVPNATSPLAARWRHIDFTHHTSFTEHSLRFVLQNGRFDTITIEGYRPPPKPSLRLWQARTRQAWWHWALLKAWRKLIETELPFEKVDEIPITLNMMAMAMKHPVSGG